MSESSTTQSSAVINPDGSISYISQCNPYLSEPNTDQENESQNNINIIMDNEQILSINQDFIYLAYLLERMGRIIRYCAMFDVIFSLIYFLMGSWLDFIGIIASGLGYYGTVRFKRPCIIIYFIYLCFVTLFRFSSPFIIPLLVNYIDYPKDIVVNGLYNYNIISGILELIIAYFVYKFLRLIPS